jgi:cell division initiation protein
MRYTPVELRHIRIGRGLLGYRRHDVDKLLEDVADSFEQVWSERGELSDKLEEAEKSLADLKEREALLSSTLVAAERAAGEAREQAKREAELIVAEAHQEARSVTRTAQGERERLFAEARRIETLMRSALGLIEETKQDVPASDEPEHWPNRQDTREFSAVEPAKLPAVQHVPDDTDKEDGEVSGRDFAWG